MGKDKHKYKFKIKGILITSVVIVIFIVALIFFIHSGFYSIKNKQNAIQTIANFDDVSTSRNDNHFQIISTSKVKEVINSASELISTKYFYTDAERIEDYKQLGKLNLPFTKSEVIFTYDGTISLGIDMSKIIVKPIDPTKKEIHIQLPDISIIANEIDMDSFEVPYEKQSIFNVQELKDYTDLIDKLKKKKENEVMKKEDLLLEAKTNAETVLQSFLESTASTQDYTIIFD